ncbi:MULTISPECIES: hypothetical protein [unclassified Serratia (in: enterobacteria)]|uniref:hypothetical protein n=1 Tax=unclassified Serratia (in: enterobacteria) TaxID=2647522 RepID=UPI003B42B8D6|nr:hypothetical protein [Serratia nematodiphila]
MQTEDKNKENQYVIHKNQKLTKEKIISAIKNLVGDNGYVKTYTDSEFIQEIYFGEEDGYRYKLLVDGVEDKYISLTLSFGSMAGFINEKGMEFLKNSVPESNNRYRCVKGVLKKESKDQESIWMDFEVRYESHSFPGLTTSQLMQHIKLAISSIDEYISDTLDVARDMG